MPLNNIYSKNGYFALAQTGNTLGMAGSATASIYVVNAYVTLNSAQNNGVGCPSNTGTYTYGGTSNLYTDNGSFAFLNPPTSVVPTGSIVDYAVLTWAGNTNAPSSLALINSATIPFTDPTGTVNIISPDLTLNNQPVGIANIISRSADVTTIVRNAGYGKYTVERVPGATLAGGNNVGGVGWELLVVYKNSSLPYRNVSINVGTVQQNVLTTITGFFTPTSGTTTTKVYGAWTQGNSDYASDSLQLNGVSLSGPNNPVNNFFCSQINNELGVAQNTFGSFANQSCTPGQRPVGQRTCFDITAVSANGVLGNAQRSASVQAIAYDGNEVANTHVLALQIDNNAPVMTATKAVNLTSANRGDTLNYTLVFKNTGIPTASNIIFTDTIPTNTTFVPGSLTINNTPSASNPQNGVALPDIATNAVVTVQFSVTVNNTIYQSTTIPNTGEIGYTFVSDPSLPGVPAQVDTNTVNTNINVTNLTATKSVDKQYAQIGDTILYTLRITNTSPNNMNSVYLVDTIPTGTTFVSNSLTKDNTPIAGNPSPPGVSIGTVAANTVTTVTFKVLVNTIPSPNRVINSATVSEEFGDVINTNSITTTINSIILSSSKTVSKSYANVGDILTYTIPISNSGNVTATSIVFLDTIPSGTSLVSGSFKQDGTLISGTPNTPGVTLPSSLKSGGITTVTFQVKIDTIPNPNPIPNSANINGSFTLDNTTTPNTIGTSITNTNIVNTQVNNASLGGITKSVDKSYADCGDIITYTIAVPNSGNVTALNVIFKDTIPTGTTFVTNSVFINGSQQPGASPGTGISVPNIAPGSTTTITFSVRVTC